MKKLSLLILALNFAGCSNGFQQDPLEGRSDLIRDGRPPVSQPPIEKPQPVPEDILRIDCDDSYSVGENKELQFRINSRVMVPGLTPTLTIDNLADFAGATFDEAKQVFTWAVGSNEGAVIRNRTVLATLSTAATETSPAFSVVKKIELLIYGDPNRPEVVSFTNLPMIIREGSFVEFNVIVKDIYAKTGSDVSVVFTGPVTGELNLAAYIRLLGEPIAYDGHPNEWIVSAILDLRGAELTSLSIDGWISVFAANKYGRKTADVLQKIGVFTNLAGPEHTWTSPLSLTVGNTGRTTFMIYDQKAEGRVSLEWDVDPATVLPGTTSTCVALASSSIVQCSLEFAIAPTEVARDLTLNAKIYNHSRAMNGATPDTFMVVRNVALPIHIAAAR